MKKVLIVTSSPFNNTKLGKMCSQLMCYLRGKGMMVAVAAWDHDTSWYVEDDEGVCWYEYQDQKVGPVYTVFNIGEGAATKLYDIIKKLQIDTILSIGDFSDVEYIYAIKGLERDNIEWINILHNGSTPINDNRSELIDSIDYHVLLNGVSSEEFVRMEVSEEKYSVERWGSIFKSEPPKEKTDKLRIACVAKNSNQSNLGCFIKAAAELRDLSDKVEFYLHTDLYDSGDYDIEYLLERYGVTETVELPDEFIGMNDGLSNKDFKNKLKNYDVIVDCSCQASTGISVLDGMALGLVPVISRVGIFRQINQELSEKHSFLGEFNIKGVSFIASDEKEFFIADDQQLAFILRNLYIRWADSGLSELSSNSQKLASTYDLETFLENTYKIIKDFQQKTNKLVVETF